MMSEIRVENRQRLKKIDTRELVRIAKGLQREAAKIAPLCGELSVEIILVDDAGCEPINKAALGHAGATDVITLRYEAIPGDSAGDSAEIIVNVERALLHADGDEAVADEEIALYVAHGFDHLCGYDDATPEGRRAMRRRELRWLKKVLKDQ